MPAKPQWLLRVPQIIEVLESSITPVVDRASVEHLFGIGRRRAIQLLHRFGGYQAGKTFLVDRNELIAQLEAIRDGEAFSRERKRRQHLVHELEQASRLQKARAVKIQVSREEVDKLRGLPEGVTVEAGQLVVQFDGVEELLRRLYELSQSAARNFYAFEKAVEGLDT